MELSTRWSVVQAACHGTEEQKRAAMEFLCLRYRAPLLAFALRKGKLGDAEDLVHDFMVSFFLEKEVLKHAHPTKGHLRGLLRKAFERFMSAEREKANTRKRGGGLTIVSLDDAGGVDADAVLVLAARADSPEEAMDRQLAEEFLSEAMRRVRKHYAAKGKGPLAEGLAVLVLGAHAAADYEQAAVRLAMSPEAVKTAVSRMRSRFWSMFREIVEEEFPPEQVRADPETVTAEVRYLVGLLETRK
ncbi:MAG: hypothetical protein JNL97_12730 [Verrucomicrobiales bacterium]|nr:hypothetical protein [Verrucomicrobiales bacterium]